MEILAHGSHLRRAFGSVRSLFRAPWHSVIHSEGLTSICQERWVAAVLGFRYRKQVGENSS